MAIQITKQSTSEILAILERMEYGVAKHVTNWPGNAPNHRQLAELINRGQSRIAELEQAKARLREAQQAVNGKAFREELLTAFRPCRDTVRAFFNPHLEDFGLKPKALPSQSTLEPETPQNLRIGKIEETAVRLAWKPLPGSVIYEIFLTGEDPTGNDQMVAASSRASVVVGNLVPGRTYHLRVRAKIANRTGEKTGPLIVHMPIPNLRI